jgi:hypothetical protein
VDISRAWENIKDNIRTYVTENLGCCYYKIINHNLMKSAQNSWIRGRRLNLNGIKNKYQGLV